MRVHLSFQLGTDSLFMRPRSHLLSAFSLSKTDREHNKVDVLVKRCFVGRKRVSILTSSMTYCKHFSSHTLLVRSFDSSNESYKSSSSDIFLSCSYTVFSCLLVKNQMALFRPSLYNLELSKSKMLNNMEVAIEAVVSKDKRENKLKTSEFLLLRNKKKQPTHIYTNTLQTLLNLVTLMILLRDLSTHLTVWSSVLLIV